MDHIIGFIGSLRRISPRVEETENHLNICVMEPQRGDWAVAITLCLIGLPLTYYTTTTPIYFGVSFIFFLVMASSLIDDTYIVIIDKLKREVSITKKRFGRIESIRVCNLSELVNCEVISTTHRNLTSFRIELEFQSEMGFYRIPASESTVIGEYNKNKFESIAQVIIKFMDLKPLPEWIKEESLASKFPRQRTSAKKPKKAQ